MPPLTNTQPTGGLGRQFGKANLETSKALSICSSDIILEFPFQAYNALLRCEQRNADAAEYHLKH
ncbi:hypothetical protein FLM03_17115 [Vibrio cholerae]|nr:hypothetical protein FLM03_17115 [Vibrio cholerae]